MKLAIAFLALAVTAAAAPPTHARRPGHHRTHHRVKRAPRPAPPVRATPAPLLSEALQAPTPGPPPGTIFFSQRTTIVSVVPAPVGDDETRPLPRGAVECVRADRIVGATARGDRAVDLKLVNGAVLHLGLAQDCPVLGFYGGFYISRSVDRLCAGRDYLVARSGQRCAIAEIRRDRK